MSIAVVGGGLSGLVVASEILHRRPDADVVVFESAEDVGGMLRTVRISDAVIDLGPDMFALQPPGGEGLCERIGLRAELIAPNVDRAGAKILHRGRLHRVPEGFVLMRSTRAMPMLRTPLLSLRGKLRWAAERWVRPRRGTDDESVGDFVRRRMGHEVLGRLVDPIVAGIYTADIDRLSMRATMPQFAAMESQHGSLASATRSRRRRGDDATERGSAGARYQNFRSFVGGMQTLPEALARQIGAKRIRCRVKIARIEREDQTDGGRDAGKTAYRLTTESGQTHRAEQVVLALPHRPASELLRDANPAAAACLGEVTSSSAAVVILRIRKSQIAVPLDMFGVVVPRSENRRVLAISFASLKFANRCPEDELIVRCFVGGTFRPEWVDETDETLVRLVSDDLRDILGWSGEPSWTHVARWKHSMPQYHVGHLELADRLHDAMSKTKALHYRGNAFGGVGIAPVIAAALKLGEAIAADLPPRRDPI